MKLTQLTEDIRDYLNEESSLEITAKAELDPLLCVLPELGIYIVPGTIQRSFQGNRPRRGAQQLTKTLFIHLIVSKEFVGLPTGVGVADWDEAKPLIDTRQDCEDVIEKYGNPKLTLSVVESQELEEYELDNRNFVAMTSFGFEICDS